MQLTPINQWNISKPFKNWFVKKNPEDKNPNLPSVNISDENKAFELSIALPGLNKKDVSIQINDNQLIISTEKRDEHEEKSKNWIRKEFSYSSYQRIFEIPQEADAEKVQAKMENGLLTIKMAKNEHFNQQNKHILVK